MPNKDKTGPEGKGPLTGGQRGLCVTDESKPRFFGFLRGRNRGFGNGQVQGNKPRDGRGQGRGRGLGRGR